MHTRRVMLLSLLMLGPGLGWAQTPPSLVGSWRGDIVGLDGNAQRSMVIQTVGADGSVTGTWSGNAFSGTLRHGELTFTTSANQKLSLRATGADTVEGFYETGGGRARRHSVVMRRTR